jgi:hypothetical protein
VNGKIGEAKIKRAIQAYPYLSLIHEWQLQ